MKNYYRDEYREYAIRFGEVAVMKEFITPSQMEQAYSEQVSSYPPSSQKPHKSIGEILLEKGWMTFEEVRAVLEELEWQQRSLGVENTSSENY